MRYITEEGLGEIKDAVYQAYDEHRKTVELPSTLAMLALLESLEQAERERDEALAALAAVKRIQEGILGNQ